MKKNNIYSRNTAPGGGGMVRGKAHLDAAHGDGALDGVGRAAGARLAGRQHVGERARSEAHGGAHRVGHPGLAREKEKKKERRERDKERKKERKKEGDSSSRKGAGVVSVISEWHRCFGRVQNAWFRHPDRRRKHVPLWTREERQWRPRGPRRGQTLHRENGTHWNNTIRANILEGPYVPKDRNRLRGHPTTKRERERRKGGGASAGVSGCELGSRGRRSSLVWVLPLPVCP